MLRPLAVLAGLVLLALLALFLTRSRAPLPAPTDAPPERTVGTNALESADGSAPVREAQASISAPSSAAAPAARIHGRVYYEGTRDPVPRAPIQIRYREAGKPESQPRLSSTDAGTEGSYSVSVPEGALLCEACVPERQSLRHDGGWDVPTLDAYVAASIDLGLRVARGDIELDLEVGAGLMLVGLVRERGSGRPIAGAEVTFQSGLHDAVGTQSAADGSFRVRGIALPDDRRWEGLMLRASASHADFVRQERAIGLPDEQGRWPELTFELEAGVVVEGIVRDARGEPVWGLDLSLRPLHGTPRPGLTEFEGEWTARSNGDGTFTFPRVPAFERAWIVTDRKLRPRLLHSDESPSWNGASRTLLHGNDLDLHSVELRLPLEVAIDVDVRYPDGIHAAQDGRLLLREDEDGQLRSAREGSKFVCVAGRATRIVAWGKPRAQDEEGVIYRGETVVTVGLAGEDPHAEIRLAPTMIERRKPEPGERSQGFGAGMWTNSAITLHFVDRATGLPLAGETLFGIEQQGNRMVSQFGGKEAVLRLYFEPGWQTLKLTVGGYRAYTIECEVKDNEPQDLTLALERLP